MNLRRQQDKSIQHLQIVLQTIIHERKTITPTVVQSVNTPLPTLSPIEPESTETQRRLAEVKTLKRLTRDLYDRIQSIGCGRDRS